jgi:acyl dehydratase
MATHFEDVKEGQTLPPVVVEKLTRTDLVKYAGASGDFNPIHHDEDFAKAAGNPTVFGHGMLTAGFVARCVTDVVGVENLRRYKVRFATRVWREGRIDGEVAAVNQKGETAVAGSFTAALPKRR